MPDAENGQHTNTPIKTPNKDRGWIRFISYVKRETHERRAKKQEESTADRSARLTANATVGLMIFTVILAATSVGTVWILKNQLREMHEGGIDTHALADATGKMKDSAEKSAQASRDFADTADVNDAVKKLDAQARVSADAIKATQNAMRLDQRAWVAVKDAHGPPLEPAVVFINTGRTPGRNVVVYPNVMYVLKGAIPDFDVDSLRPKRLGLLSPGTEREINSTMVVPDLERRDVYIFGKITYDDVFRKPHWVTYCLRLSDDGKRYQFCEKHNDTDGIGQPQKAD